MAAASLNKVLLIGNLGKDPDIQSFDGDREKASFPLATNYSYRNKNNDLVQRTEWHNIVLWFPSLVKKAKKYLKKGNSIYLEGRIQTRSYEDPNSGDRKYITEIVGNDLFFLDKRGYAENTYEGPTDDSESAQPSPSNANSSANNTEIDDLPF